MTPIVISFDFFSKTFFQNITVGAKLEVRLICMCSLYAGVYDTSNQYNLIHVLKISTSHVKLTDCIIIIIKDVFLCVLSTYRKTSLERKIPTSVFSWLNTFRDHN